MQKKGMELSLNMIIIVVLALVFLGIAVTLMYKWLGGVEIPRVPSACEIYPPTSANPVCVNKAYEFSRGETVELEVSFYNNEDAAWDDTLNPTITCKNSPDGDTLALSVTSTGSAVEVGSAEDYLLVSKVPKDAARGTYPCTLKISNTQESFSITIK
jgi:hypothetical protein